MCAAGRPATVTRVEDLDEGLVRDLWEVVDARPQKSPNEIFKLFALAKHGVTLSTFRRRVYDRRKRQASQHVEQRTAATQEESIDALSERVLRNTLKFCDWAAQAGDMKPYQIAAVLRAAHDRGRLAIERTVEERARELYETKAREADEKRRAAKAVADRRAGAAMSKAGMSDEARRAIQAIYGVVVDE
jgi:hypothetical protein